MTVTTKLTTLGASSSGRTAVSKTDNEGSIPSASAIDPLTIHCLVNAIEDLLAAQQKTAHGFVSDYCENALTEIKKAMLCIIGE